ncbi:unnamed protein product [Plutella xylostella]|uniref:Short-chain dehydrogenase/reductase 3 n=1 Tax=Plutella xylostella TaxID=51655 RepID=A0A8S4G8M2_PLUXY|nr:unnamed protein product [Plutella xylostella]
MSERGYGRIMAEQEPPTTYEKTIDALKLTGEILWTIVQIWVAIFQSIYAVFFPMEPKDVSGEIILISGTGHGMGREMALRFARLKATVVCVDINPKGNQETVDMIKQEKGKAFRYECDISDRAAVFALQQKVAQEVGSVTVLVNNAGIMPCRPFLETTEKEVRLMNEINVMGGIWMLQAFLPPMLARNHGHIVAMASMAGMVGSKNLVPYCGTKFAVRGIMQALAVELRQEEKDYSGIKMTTVCPYIVNTGLAHNPKIRFKDLMKPVEPSDAAEQIVNAMRRELVEITVPGDLWYSSYKFPQLLPARAVAILQDFTKTGVEPHAPNQFE